MTKKGMRGFAGGLYISAALIAYVYYTGDSVEETAAKQPEITATQVQSFLASQDKVAVDADTYEQLQALKKKDSEKESSEKDSTEENKEKQKSDEETSEEKEKVHKATIVIQQGMSSQQVITKLKNAKIIQSEDKFFDYLDNNNLLQEIRFGTYQLNSNMSFQEIAEEIT